jgi:hypothetical protein
MELDDEILKIAPYSEIFGKNFPLSVKLRWIWMHYKIVIILLLLLIIAYVYKKYSQPKSYVMF